jgi:hypothetical protein
VLSLQSQKYYKLRKESAKLFDDKKPVSQPATPKKRKASEAETTAETPSPTKRQRDEDAQHQAIDGEPFSDGNDMVKAEDMAANILDSFHSYDASFAAAPYYPSFHANGYIAGGESSGSASFLS